MSSPTLSIIVPIYNVDRFLPMCLDSIAHQTFTDWECFLIDDGSTDWSGSICDIYASRDRRFSVIHQKNAGVSTARNRGINAAKGNYISFVDPDDWISVTFYQEMLLHMVESNADHSFCKVEPTTENGSIFHEFPLFSPHFVNNVLEGQELIDNLFNMTCGCWGQVYERSLWDNLRFSPDVSLGEDTEILPQVVSRAKRSVYCENAQYFYRIRAGSLAHHNISKNRLLGMFGATDRMKQKCHRNFQIIPVSLHLPNLTLTFGFSITMLNRVQHKERANYTIFLNWNRRRKSHEPKATAICRILRRKSQCNKGSHCSRLQSENSIRTGQPIVERC